MAAAHGGERSSGGGASSRRWEDLNQDVLVTIFAKLELADLILGVPFACTSWRDAAGDPACWRILDFRDWDSLTLRLGCRRLPSVDFADLLNFSVSRCDGDLDSIYFPDFADDIDLQFVASRCPKLHYFNIPNPEVSEEEFCKAIGKFEFLKGMAVDESLICHEVLLHIRHCCSDFSELRVFADTVDEDTASVICVCLPNLHKLEITDCTLSRLAILTFLDELKELEHLDISGYANSGITGVVIEKASRLKVFRWDSIYEEGDFEYCSECDEDWLSQRPCECVLDRTAMEWLAALP